MDRLIRAAAFRARRAAETAAAGCSGAVLALRRVRWERAGRTDLPEDAWPVAPAIADPADALLPLANRIMPLPPAAGLARWLWGEAGGSNDGGDRSSGLLALRLRDPGPGPDEGSFSTADAVALVAERAAADGGRGPHTLLLVAGDGAAGVATALRTAGVHRGCLVLADPGTDRRAALLSLCAAVAVPTGTGPLHSAWAREAGAAAVPLLSHAATAPLPRDLGRPAELRTAGRRARHALVSADPAVLQPVPGALPDRGQPRASGIVVGTEHRRVVVAGHDLKFARGLIEHLRAEGHQVRLDEWTGHERHDPRRSRELAGWADAVLCEWTLGNAVWYSRHLPHGTRLTLRLHLQEAATGFPARVDAGRVDAAVFVADHVRRQVVRDAGWPAARSLVVPNAVRIPELPDPAVAGEPGRDAEKRFRLGLVGIVPSRKGLDTALDVLRRLRALDARYSLSIKGRQPSEYPWMADRPAERDYFSEQFARIDHDPLLGAAVGFAPFGPDMDSWFSTIGIALSTSEFESFHFTLPDGAAHGALPRSVSWPGADLLYPTDWLAPDADSLADSIRAATQDPTRWSAQTAAARQLVIERFAAGRVLPELADVVLGRRVAEPSQTPPPPGIAGAGPHNPEERP